VSSLTFGPPVVIDDGHLPVSPPYSLLNTPGVLKDPGDAHWLSGAAIYPYPAGTPTEWDPCSTGTFREKEEGEGVESQYFASFVSYLPITCSAISIGDPQEFARRAEIALDAVQSFSAERQLALGTGVSTNPYLADAAHTLTAAGATATAPDPALAYLEEEIGETGKQGMIHATPPVVSRWFDQNRAFTRQLITANGTRVVSGGGYQAATPSGRTPAAAGQSWVYATGPVEVRLGTVAVMDIKEVLDRSNNDVTFRAERYVLVTWDAQLQAAILVNWAA
jgi:hypothetical protein